MCCERAGQSVWAQDHLWPFMLTSVRVTRVHSALRRKRREGKKDSLWSCTVLTTSATAPWLLTCKSQPGICYCLKTRTHKYIQAHTYRHTWREIRVYVLAIQKSQWGCRDLWGWGGDWMDGWMDGWMDCRREDRMTGWQNIVKDTLQYYVTAWKARQGLREPGGRWERKQGEEIQRGSERSNICGFSFLWLPSHGQWWEERQLEPKM